MTILSENNFKITVSEREPVFDLVRKIPVNKHTFKLFNNDAFLCKYDIGLSPFNDDKIENYYQQVIDMFRPRMI